MTMPRRFAALAVCLLALAGSAAAGACSGNVGSITMELVQADATLLSNEIATCLSSLTINVDTDCNVFIGAPAADNSFLPSLWSSDASSYKQYKLCPLEGPKIALGSDAAGNKASILLALNSYAYGVNEAGNAALKTSGAALSYAPGVVTVTLDTDKTLVYAIRDATAATVTKINDSTNLVVATATSLAAVSGLAEGTEYRNTLNIGEDCVAGRYGLPIGEDVKLCPLCPAGTTGDGNGCKACSAGYAYGSVGLASDCDAVDKQCQEGTYAPEGSSTCLPCPMHTFAATDGAGECMPCPANTYAWLPGSSACMVCNDGVPSAVTTAQSAGTAGSAILTVPSKLTTCTLDSTFPVPVWNKCTTWSTADGTLALKLALEVAADCSITVKPISDSVCSDPGAVDGQTKLVPLTGQYDYTYNELLIRAYYTSTNTIRTLLPSTDGGASSFMLNIDALDADEVTLAFFAATNKPEDAGNPGSLTCAQNMTAAGGYVAGASAACTAGSYSSSSSCFACPQGHTCDGTNAQTDCTATNANPYLGKAAGACTTCDQTNTNYTSLAGAAYCTVPYFDRVCNRAPFDQGGYEWDENANACVKCRPGTYRSTEMLPTGSTPNPECQECPAGTYSGEGASGCDPCPTGQYNPTTGMADQQVGSNGIRCLLCPGGSIALADGESMNINATIDTSDYRNELALSTGAIKCDACPSGTWADPAKTQLTTNAKGCSLCDSGYYRIGDASPENNICKKIPAGYKATSVLDTTSPMRGAYAIGVCAAGSVSSWSGSIRTPLDATDCKLCSTENSGNSSSIAARTGMAACSPCKGGFYPDASHTSCVQCAVGYFRSFYTIDDVCAACPAGFEVGPSNRQACTQCRPGMYKTDASDGTTDKDFCDECPVNTYMPKPGASGDIGLANGCIWCAKGYETQDKGNTECTPCAIGYYNPKQATSSSSPACKPAPAGTFVNTTGAFFATQCAVGTFNADTAQDACEPCPPGQYANTLGNRACKTCPAGTYSGAQASTCKACAAGYYAPAGSGACSPCKPGTYSSNARSTTCKLCPKGFQCPTPATKAPKACPAGTFASKDGSSLCTPCPVNTYAGSAQATKCVVCPAGTNTRGLTGQKACTAVRVNNLRRSVL